MPFSISVYRRSDLFWIRSPPRALLEDPDRLDAEWSRRVLYAAPLGSGDFVYTYWSAPSAALGLRLLSALYEKGLEASGAELDELAHELSLLEEAWRRQPAEPQNSAVLQERVHYVKEAIRVAQEKDGVVDIR